MADQNNKVFISYRRDGGKHIARLIYDDLVANEYDVFFDIKTINSGEFDTKILTEIPGRTHFILVLTKDALKRCSDSRDWLRREIEEAFRNRCNIVPVMEEGFSFAENEKYLTGKLQELKRLNALPLYHYYFEAAMTELRGRFLHQKNAALTPAERKQAEELFGSKAQTRLKADGFWIEAMGKRISQEYDAIIALNSQAIALVDDDPKYYSDRAFAYLQTKQYIKCIADCNKVLQLDKDGSDLFSAFHTRATARLYKGDHEIALADFQKCLDYCTDPETITDIEEVIRMLKKKR